MFSEVSPPPRSGQGEELYLNGADALAFARRRYSRLSADGVGVYPGAEPQAIHANQVETAMRFLKKLVKTKRAAVGVGTLKHVAEDWGREHGLCAYVSRGALISAAVALGYPTTAYYVGVSQKPLARLISNVRDLRRERLASR